MARSGIREAAGDHARLRVVLTGFATELGQLRALSERRVPASVDLSPEACDEWAKAVGDINGYIRMCVNDALAGLPSSDAAKEGGSSAGANAAPP